MKFLFPYNYKSLFGFLLCSLLLFCFSIIKANETLQLIDSIRGGNHTLAAKMLQQGAVPKKEIDARDENGRTALTWAAFKGNLELLQKLTNLHADVESVDNAGMSPLMYASIEGNPEIVTWLLDHGSTINRSDLKGKTPLILAAVYGKSKVVKILLDYGANPLLRDHNGMTALELIEYKKFPEIKALLVNFRLNSPPEKNSSAIPSSKSGKRIKNPASPQLMLTSLPLKIRQEEKHKITGQEALLWHAARQGNPIAANHLIETGTDVNARDPDGMSALMWAARYNRIQMVKRLLSLGANLHLREYSYSWNALMWASRFGHTEVVSLLVEQGGELQAKDKFNWTALDIALAHHQKETVQFLEGMGP
ncbi:MAG: ankyrin repeat domain-containing protein [SAR324 cluster bacterium]|nr:ankyrin repeat domain-containing protein [SAR324 cluster bacterium]